MVEQHAVHVPPGEPPKPPMPPPGPGNPMPDDPLPPEDEPEHDPVREPNQMRWMAPAPGL